jgi:hypothetical protein
MSSMVGVPSTQGDNAANALWADRLRLKGLMLGEKETAVNEADQVGD